MFDVIIALKSQRSDGVDIQLGASVDDSVIM